MMERKRKIIALYRDDYGAYVAIRYSNGTFMVYQHQENLGISHCDKDMKSVDMFNRDIFCRCGGGKVELSLLCIPNYREEGSEQ